MPGATSFLSEAELHGLVDGHIAGGRRGDLLRRAAASPRDQECIASWQNQNDLIRATFRSVEREPVPATLDLRAPARLHCVPAIDTSRTMPGCSALPRSLPRRRVAGTLFTALIIVGGLAGAWTIAGSTDVPAPVETSASIEDVLSRRAVAALEIGRPSVATTEPIAMPTTSIPDLSALGFWLTGADMQPRKPATLVFRYRNAAAERIAVGVAETAAGQEQAAAASNTDVVVWRKGSRAFAMAGTLRKDRLRSLATSLRNGAAEK